MVDKNSIELIDDTESYSYAKLRLESSHSDKGCNFSSHTHSSSSLSSIVRLGILVEKPIEEVFHFPLLSRKRAESYQGWVFFTQKIPHQQIKITNTKNWSILNFIFNNNKQYPFDKVLKDVKINV